MGHCFARGQRDSFGDFGRLAASVDERDLERRDGLQDALRAVACDHCAQHRVARDRVPPACREASHVELGHPELAIHVTRDISQGHELLPSKPVRLLHRREREWLVSVYEVRLKCGFVGVRWRKCRQGTGEVTENGILEDSAERQLQ